MATKTENKLISILKKYGVKKPEELEDRLNRTRRHYSKLYQLSVPKISGSTEYNWNKHKISKINPKTIFAHSCCTDKIKRVQYFFDRGTFSLKKAIEEIKKIKIDFENTVVFIKIY